MFADLKGSLTKEIQEFRDESKAFQERTDKDIKIIMDQTAELRKDVEKTEKRVSCLESRVSCLRLQPKSS